MKIESYMFEFHGMRTALGELKLEQIALVYPGTKRYSLDKRVTAVPLDAVADGMKGLFPKRMPRKGGSRKET
jgi:hypothetical protein